MQEICSWRNMDSVPVLKFLARDQIGMGETKNSEALSTCISFFTHALKRSICHINHGNSPTLLDLEAPIRLSSMKKSQVAHAESHDFKVLLGRLIFTK